MSWLLPFPLPPSPVSQLDRATHRKTEKERQIADGREGEGLGEEPRGEKAWSSKSIQFSLVAVCSWNLAPIFM
jgi:hypothetical protein